MLLFVFSLSQVLLFVASGSLLRTLAETPKAPVYPKSFEVEYYFSLPYESELQKDGVRYSVHLWRDAESRRTRTDTYNSTNILIQTQEATYEVVPRITKLICMGAESNGPDEASLYAPVLPDVSAWMYKGNDTLEGKDVNVWALIQEHAGGAKVTNYTFYATPEGEPVRLHMIGQDLFSGSHFDEYQADYVSYKPGRVSNHFFDIPSPCKDVTLSPLSANKKAGVLRKAALLPRINTYEGGKALWSAFISAFGVHRNHPQQLNAEARLAIFQSNYDYIQQWNAQAGQANKHKLKINRFADWTEEEFRSVMLPRKGRRTVQARRDELKASAELPYERIYPKGRIPSAVDWRGTGAVDLVKDQAACGSCWAFGATGTLQGAYFMATGKTVRFSEQQLMDCSWEHGNNACDGGEYDAALDYLAGVGGSAYEKDYEYLGQDGYCSVVEGNFTQDSKPLTKLKGYAYVPVYDDEALMEAVYSRGPIAVSMDAAHPSFSFYASGVYDEPKCSWLPEDMDHAVTLIGYGTEDGKDFWLIRNSWSSHWGDEGVIKVARARKGCGITSSPMYALFEEEPDALSASV